MKLKAWASVMALVVLPHVASGDIDSTVLMKHKDWEVTHDYLSSTDSSACSADTTNGSGDLFSLITWERGGASLMIMMASDFEGWDGTFSADCYPTHRLRTVDLERCVVRGASDGPAHDLVRLPRQYRQGWDFLEDLWRAASRSLSRHRKRKPVFPYGPSRDRLLPWAS